MIKDDFIQFCTIYLDYTGSLWKNKKNCKLPGYKQFPKNNIFANEGAYFIITNGFLTTVWNIMALKNAV